MNCPKCGRFMRLVGGYSDDHLDSWEDSWVCVTRHPTAEQKARRKALVEESPSGEPNSESAGAPRDSVRFSKHKSREGGRAVSYNGIEQGELADRLREVVIGRKLTRVDGETITLDNGTQIRISGSSDCCAWGDATLGKIADSEHVITGVRSVDDGDPNKATVFLMTDAGSAMEIAQEWDESNGYYFYGLYLTVSEAGA